MPRVSRRDYTRWVQVRNDRDDPITNVRLVYRTRLGITRTIPLADRLEAHQLIALPLLSRRIQVRSPYVLADFPGSTDPGRAVMVTSGPGRHLRFMHLAVCRSGKVGGYGRYATPDSDGNTPGLWPC